MAETTPTNIPNPKAAVQNAVVIAEVASNPKAAAKTVVGLLSGNNSRIGNGIALTLILFAIIADLFSLIPFVGDFVGPFFWIYVSFFLWMKGCGFLNYGRVATEGISMVAEMIPAVQELPTIVVGMIIVILLIRFEDRTGVSLVKPLSQGQRPLNIDGVRQPQSASGQTLSLDNRDSQPLNTDGVRQPVKADSGYGAVGKSSPYGEQAGPYAGAGSTPPKQSLGETLSGTMGSAKARALYEKEIQDNTYIQAKSMGYTEEQAREQGRNSTKDITEQSWKAHRDQMN